MLEPLDRFSRDSTLFQFTSRRLRDFIDPKHLLIQIDEEFDFAKLVEPLEDYYCRDNGRPVIHPEVLVRALLISALYNITSFRRLCSAISENIAFRWFCFLSIDDRVFDHSTISHFIERIGDEGFADIFDRFNEELLRLGLLSRQMYTDSSLVKANVGRHGLSHSGMSVEEFREKAVEENGLFVLREQQVDENGVESERVRYFQDSRGRSPLNDADIDARWSTKKRNRRPDLNYKENVIVDSGGFIVARRGTRGSEGDWKPVSDMLEQLPVRPETLTGDTGYSAGRLRERLEGLGITAYIPIQTRTTALLPRGVHLSWRPPRVSRRKGSQKTCFHRRDRSYQYVARQKDCQRCPVRTECLPPRQKRRYVALTMYQPVYLRARERNESEAYRREMKRRQATVEGVFASLDRLGWARCKLRGLWKVDCEGYILALAHNLKKAVFKLGGMGPPTPAATVATSR